MKKERFRKYGINLTLTEFHDNEQITCVNLLDYFELTNVEDLLKILDKFNKNLKAYLIKHNLVKKEDSKLE